MTPTRVTHERQRVFALDTNIFIYHFEENPAYVGFTEALFERIESGRVKAVTSALTLHEVLTGARKAGDDRLFSLYRDLIGTFQQGAETFVTNDARLKRIREIKVTLPRKAS